MKDRERKTKRMPWEAIFSTVATGKGGGPEDFRGSRSLRKGMATRTKKKDRHGMRDQKTGWREGEIQDALKIIFLVWQ